MKDDEFVFVMYLVPPWIEDQIYIEYAKQLIKLLLSKRYLILDINYGDGCQFSAVSGGNIDILGVA
ncbi:hypothetical protein KQH27_00370 [bacterium]|nr:hypothetical protein [bacterium]